MNFQDYSTFCRGMVFLNNPVNLPTTHVLINNINLLLVFSFRYRIIYWPPKWNAISSLIGGWVSAVVRRFTCSKIRTTELSNNWDVQVIRKTVKCVVVRRFTCSKVHSFENSNNCTFEQLGRTTFPKSIKKYNVQLFEDSLVRRFTYSKIRTTEPSNNWDVHMFEGSLIRRFTCSNFRIFEQLNLRTTGTSQLFEISLVRKVKNVKCAVVRRPSCSKYSP